MVLLGAALGLCCKRANPGRAREKSPTTTVPSASFVATQLQDGDLIFQESTSRQSEMVRALTNSRWTHMGVVFNEAGGPIVLEAVSPVGKAPLQKWIARGRDGRYVVKRLRDADNRLSKEVVGRMQKLGASWLGRPYDLRFRWDDQALYCARSLRTSFSNAPRAFASASSSEPRT